MCQGMVLPGAFAQQDWSRACCFVIAPQISSWQCQKLLGHRQLILQGEVQAQRLRSIAWAEQLIGLARQCRDERNTELKGNASKASSSLSWHITWGRTQQYNCKSPGLPLQQDAMGAIEACSCQAGLLCQGVAATCKRDAWCSQEQLASHSCLRGQPSLSHWNALCRHVQHSLVCLHACPKLNMLCASCRS